MCKYLQFCRRYLADENLWTKVCGRGFADKYLQRRKFGDTMIYASKKIADTKKCEAISADM